MHSYWRKGRCLTIHSSRTRFAGRLNSGVIRQGGIRSVFAWVRSDITARRFPIACAWGQLLQKRRNRRATSRGLRCSGQPLLPGASAEGFQVAGMARPDAAHRRHPDRCRITNRSTGTRIGAGAFGRDPAIIGFGADPWRVRSTQALGRRIRPWDSGRTFKTRP